MRPSIFGMPRPGGSTYTNCSSISRPSFCRRSWRSGSSGGRLAAAQQTKERNMIKWFLRRRLAAFERAWNYDAGYMHEILEADPSALIAFSKVASLGRYHKDAPLAAYHAVRIVGT